MARTNVPIAAQAANTENADPATTALDATNGHAIAAGGNTDRLVIEVQNTAVGAKTVTFRAGVNPPATRASVGDLVASLELNEVSRFSLESGRFAQADGSIHVDIEAGMTGTIRAIRLPRV